MFILSNYFSHQKIHADSQTKQSSWKMPQVSYLSPDLFQSEKIIVASFLKTCWAWKCECFEMFLLWKRYVCRLKLLFFKNWVKKIFLFFSGYSNQDSLKAHIHNHHVNNRAFPCQVCSKSFSTTSNLKNHVRIVHLMERPYECSECGKTYVIYIYNLFLRLQL